MHDYKQILDRQKEQLTLNRKQSDMMNQNERAIHNQLLQGIQSGQTNKLGLTGVIHGLASESRGDKFRQSAKFVLQQNQIPGQLNTTRNLLQNKASPLVLSPKPPSSVNRKNYHYQAYDQNQQKEEENQIETNRSRKYERYQDKFQQSSFRQSLNNFYNVPMSPSARDEQFNLNLNKFYNTER